MRVFVAGMLVDGAVAVARGIMFAEGFGEHPDDDEDYNINVFDKNVVERAKRLIEDMKLSW